MFATEYNINYTNLPWLVSASISFLHFFVSDRRANQQGENRNHTAYKITVNYLPMTKMEDLLDTRVFLKKKKKKSFFESRVLLVVKSTYWKRKSENQMQRDMDKNHDAVICMQLHICFT